MWKKRQREKFRFHLFNARCTTDSRVAIEAQNAHKKIKWKQFSVCKCITLQKKPSSIVGRSIFGIVCKMKKTKIPKMVPKLSQHLKTCSCEIRCILKLVSCHEISIFQKETEKKLENEDAERNGFSHIFVHKRVGIFAVK